jgi:pimeloyl-ACP methyl ester carboxylesterase
MDGGTPFVVSATGASAAQAPPAGIAALAERFDPEPIDVSGGRARIRLELTGGDAWDAVIERQRLSLEAADPAAEPDALLRADAASWRALDLPGSGESDKPIGAPYDTPWFARAVFETMDALGVERAHLAGNSMAGRIAIEAGLMRRERIGGLVLLTPALAWLRGRRWAPVARCCGRSWG